jgi:hypothetical protein
MSDHIDGPRSIGDPSADTELKRAASEKTVGRLVFLDASVGGRIVSVNADGSDRKVIVDGCRTPDGIVVDPERESATNHGNPGLPKPLGRGGFYTTKTRSGPSPIAIAASKGGDTPIGGRIAADACGRGLGEHARRGVGYAGCTARRRRS